MAHKVEAACRLALRLRQGGTVIVTDDDGWHTGTGLAAGTSYTYRFATGEGAVTVVNVSTNP